MGSKLGLSEKWRQGEEIGRAAGTKRKFCCHCSRRTAILLLAHALAVTILFPWKDSIDSKGEWDGYAEPYPFFGGDRVRWDYTGISFAAIALVGGAWVMVLPRTEDTAKNDPETSFLRRSVVFLVLSTYILIAVFFVLVIFL